MISESLTMNTVHDARNAPPGLLDYLKAAEGRLVFRRKVVLVKDVIHKQWSMLGLVLSPESKGASSQAVTYRYADAVLLSDVMTSGHILSFFREASEGQVTIGGEQVLVTQTPAPGCDKAVWLAPQSCPLLAPGGTSGAFTTFSAPSSLAQPA